VSVSVVCLMVVTPLEARAAVSMSLTIYLSIIARIGVPSYQVVRGFSRNWLYEVWLI